MTDHKRLPQIEARIQRLLAAVSGVTAASDIATAWSNIFAAVKSAEQAESDPWKIDPLSAQEVKVYADGSVRVPQLGHSIYINKNGAFGIKDLWSQKIVVEKSGLDGESFYMPTA